MTKSVKNQYPHTKPTQKELIKEWLLAGERLDVSSVRKRTGNYAFHLFGRINELKNDGFRFQEKNIQVKEGSPYKIVWLHPEFVKDIEQYGLENACAKELQRKALEKEMECVA